MLDQLFNLVKQFGKNTVVENSDVPNEQNEAVMAEASNTIGGGLQNIMAGGGFQNILDLFKGGGNTTSKGGLLKNPIITMMIGHFISKLVNKFKMKPAAASNVSNNLIPNVLGNLIDRTKSQDPENDAFDFNDLIGSLTGGKVATSESSSKGFDFQGLLNQLVGGKEDEGSKVQDISSQVTQGAQQHQEEQGAGGLMNLIKGFFSR
ncbi:MAG: hypothetical protein ABIR30_08230 [Chitinophagaceae bacterium]